MDKLRVWMTRFDESLNEKNVFTNFLCFCEEKTGINRKTIAYGFIAILATYMLFGYGSDILVLLVGFIYPAYQSVRAIESSEKEDDTKWLTYWVVFASVQLIEACTMMLVYYIPLYSIIKCIFLLYCMAPVKENGSLFLYKRVIRPFVLQHSEAIDTALGGAAGIAETFIEGGILGFTSPSMGHLTRVCFDCGRIFHSSRGLMIHRRIHRRPTNFNDSMLPQN